MWYNHKIEYCATMKQWSKTTQSNIDKSWQPDIKSKKVGCRKIHIRWMILFIKFEKICIAKK